MWAWLLLAGGCTQLFSTTGQEEGTPKAFDYTLSNIPVSEIEVGEEELVLQVGTTIFDTTAGTIAFDDGSGNAQILSDLDVSFASLRQTVGGQIGVFAFQSLTIPSGAVLQGIGDDFLVLVVGGDVMVDGRIDVGAQGLQPGPGGHTAGTSGMAGSGPGGGSAARTGFAGGHGASYGTPGALGGANATGDALSDPYGYSDLRPLVGGSGGGSNLRTSGGAGSGSIQISAANTIRIGAGGAIGAGGGGGQGAPGQGSTTNGGGGGGSGGGILLEAPSIQILGWVGANGGGGGGADLGDIVGAPGEDGQPDRDAQGGSGAGALDNGGAGSDYDGNASEGATSPSAGGGGGGGGGRIRLNSDDAFEDVGIRPSLASGASTAGPLTRD